jgi:predicted metalloprotease
MRWKRSRRSGDIIDRRGSGSGFSRGPMSLGVGGGGLGLVALIVFVLLNSGVLGGGLDVRNVPELGGGAPGSNSPEEDDKLVDFMSFVLDDAQGFWSDALQQANRTYERAELVIFTEATNSGCGGATVHIGPHYCPADERIYLDLTFFRELRNRFDAPGDFAQAYVLAHEIAHHVQNELGISGDVYRSQRDDPEQANDLSVRLELQADCFSGVWAFTTYERRILESGDLEEGLAAAAAVGDDRIQRETTGRIDRETWTHGSSEQRVSWFKRGFEDGDANDCDTFSADAL